MSDYIFPLSQTVYSGLVNFLTVCEHATRNIRDGVVASIQVFVSSVFIVFLFREDFLMNPFLTDNMTRPAEHLYVTRSVVITIFIFQVNYGKH